MEEYLELNLADFQSWLKQDYLVMQEWVTDIRDQCLRANVPFFFKQWGGVHLCLRHWRGQKKRAGRTLEGRTWDEMPVKMSLVKA